MSSSPPEPRLIARSIVSFGMLASLAAWMAERSRGFMVGSAMPERAATVSSRINFVKTLARLASCAPLRYMMFLNCEWPAISKRTLYLPKSSEAYTICGG